MSDIPEHIKQAFRDGNSDDILKRLLAWNKLERAGLATSYVVGGRFVHLSLTEEGARQKALVLAE